ncbi:MAG: glycosyltransferase [Acidobacteria bacterium]|nr:glycosyltransferase [Acidobacteriota bacterium]
MAGQGVTFVLPVLNGRRWLGEVLDGIAAQHDGRPFEILAVDDGSVDGSVLALRRHESAGVLGLRVLAGPGRGAAAAINCGIREAAHPLICQIDQDVILTPGWLTSVLAALTNPDVVAAQGHYVTGSGAGFWARVMGRDLEQRYAGIRAGHVNHVCTGNTAYRASALHRIGLLDERLGYGYDNDLSYRLTAAGHRLAFCRDAISVHRWREGAWGYLRQQFGVGYGRLDVIARHPRRIAGDDVSGVMMMLHAPVMLLALCAAAITIAAAAMGYPAGIPGVLAAALLTALMLERSVAGALAWHRTGDAAALGFCVAHLARDLAWSAAVVAWAARRVARHADQPSHSMPRLTNSRRRRGSASDGPGPHRLLAVIPAFNEAKNLPRVVRELRRHAPQVDVLIVNDGSTDDTAELLEGLGVSWLTLTTRVGVGGAVRAGLRYAVRNGYHCVVRVDGDGQHRASEIAALFRPVVAGRLDAVIGSRFLHRRRDLTPRRAAQWALAAGLSALTGKRITDPTSGFCLFGPCAVRLLGRHHPTGYAEPELLLLLSRNGMRFGEVPIRMRARLAGRTSLTVPRAAVALARTLLALVIVPTRALLADGDARGDD